MKATAFTETCTECGQTFQSFCDVICPPCKRARAEQFMRELMREAK